MQKQNDNDNNDTSTQQTDLCRAFNQRRSVCAPVQPMSLTEASNELTVRKGKLQQAASLSRYRTEGGVNG